MNALNAAYTSVLATARTEVATAVTSGLQAAFDVGKGECRNYHASAGDLHGMG